MARTVVLILPGAFDPPALNPAPAFRRIRPPCALLAAGVAVALLTLAEGRPAPADSPVPAALATPLPASAPPGPLKEVAPAPPKKLSLDELIAMAQANHPAIGAAAARVDAARGTWVQAGLGPNPVAGYSGDEMGPTSGFQGGFVAKRFITGGKLRLNRTVASQEIAKAQAELAAAEQRVVNDVRTGYYDVLVAQRALEVTNKLVQIADDSTRIAKQLWDRGEASEADWRQHRIDANLIRINQATQNNRYLAAWRRVAALVGDPQSPPRELLDDLTNGVPDVKWPDVVQRTITASPEVAAAFAEIERARWAVRRAEVEPIPDVTLQGGVMRDNVDHVTMASAMASIPLPIIDTNRGGIRQAIGELRRAQSEAQRLELRLHSQLAGAFARYETAKTTVERYNKEILADAEATLTLIRKTYEAGEVDYLKHLTAQRTYFQTRLDYIEALGDLRRAAIQLEGFMLSGSLDQMTPPSSEPMKSGRADSMK